MPWSTCVGLIDILNPRPQAPISNSHKDMKTLWAAAAFEWPGLDYPEQDSFHLRCHQASPSCLATTSDGSCLSPMTPNPWSSVTAVIINVVWYVRQNGLFEKWVSVMMKQIFTHKQRTLTFLPWGTKSQHPALFAMQEVGRSSHPNSRSGMYIGERFKIHYSLMPPRTLVKGRDHQEIASMYRGAGDSVHHPSYAPLSHHDIVFCFFFCFPQVW